VLNAPVPIDPVGRRAVLACPAGSDESWPLEVLDGGDPPRPADLRGPGDADPVVALACWPGDDRAALALGGSSVAVEDAAAGRLRLDLAGSDTAGLAPGDYRLQLAIVAGGRSTRRDLGILRLTAAPGSAAGRPAYCTPDDLRRLAGSWLDDQAEHDADQAGFLEQRADARNWLDGLVQRHYRGGSWARQSTLDHLLDGGGGAGRWPRRRDGRHDARLQAWLDADRLALDTPDGRRLVDACACWALARICDRQLGGGENDPWPARARRYRAQAEHLAAGSVAGIDTTEPADGVADLVIDLGTADRLRA
jgi:hypothetical protein